MGLLLCNASTEDGTVKEVSREVYFLLNETRLHPDDMENALVAPFLGGMRSLSLTLYNLSTELNLTRIGCRVVYSMWKRIHLNNCIAGAAHLVAVLC